MTTKKPKEHKCKVCGSYFVKSKSTQKVCSVDCAVKLSKEEARKKREKIQKAERVETAKRMRARKEALKTRRDWLNDLQKIFNKFIRLRDRDEPCISCCRYHQGQWHAGHYKTVGSSPELRFDEKNVHKQCSACNNHKSGNVTEYRINLIRKIGVEEVEKLERKDHPPLKLTNDEIKVKIALYKNKIKELEGRE
ncbi:recombination protein NinG [Pasteurella multocida]|uniref:recombination protein NinG n=1 Tax=Pasteurella multocida TaxID=747 RepID=UPI00099A0032|nr:recombination protein NinG [Pasteurella multocida]MCL7756108.1 recombination protein NinG [Pasteurella multocida]MCL7779838.1 recombination protein NinG [Pasteurella multocida]OPC90902.1 protein NinG [Pasteurella multocida subsp. septica]OPD03831.1 protein NinG [Pasteurella multocida subsp. septica]OPD04923.1 protein NinG [Pasteurella multocida subsp. septica]